jgi:outer membrane protein
MKQVILSTVIALAIVGSASFVLQNKMKTRTGYIEIKKVFNGFSMKKELEEKFKQTAKVREKIIDSLTFNLKLMSKELNGQRDTKGVVNQELAYAFDLKREELLKLRNQFGQENSALSQKYDNQILEQMTQYVIEFGKKNNYDIIYGADGSGNLMYAKDSYNISDEIVTFINKKYKGIE